MCLDTARRAERILQVLKWDLPKQRLSTQPAPPGDKDEPKQKAHRFAFDILLFQKQFALFIA